MGNTCMGDSAYCISLWILKESSNLLKFVKCVVSSVSEKASRSLITAKRWSSETKEIHANRNGCAEGLIRY